MALTHLHIRNYALISSLDIDFSEGFSVITGETGAGKSIILGAIGLIMGQRADNRAISEGAQKCTIEAEFDISDYGLAPLFEENDWDYDDRHCLIRRELLASGKSRSFINDTPAPLSALRLLAERLIDIHSQHENLLLASNRFQLHVVDSVARNGQERALYTTAFEAAGSLQKQLQETEQRAAQSKAEVDYLSFQLTQLDDARLQAGELPMLEDELRQVTHAEDIKAALSRVNNSLSAEQLGALPQLKQSIQELRRIAPYMQQLQAMEERMQSAYLELDDLASEVASVNSRLDYDPQRQQQLEERVDMLHSLMQKHRVQTIEELISLREQLRSRLTEISSFDEQIARLQTQFTEARKQLAECADRLTNTRRAAVPAIEQQITDMLRPLGIAHPQLHIDLRPLPAPEAGGADDLHFLFAANKNQQPQDVAQVASGGEISRLMLCIKSLLADTSGVPTLIFDEIDTGISGDVATAMGRIMSRMGSHLQVIAITHLPQIAAQGQAHYLVYKQDNAQRTETHITRLTPEERVQAIAHMLSGATPTDAALQNARELLAGK